MRLNLTFYLFAVFLLLGPLGTSTLNAQEPSIIDQMQKAQASVVNIEAEIASLYKSPPSKPVLNPKTGRLIVVRNLAKSSFLRSGAGVVIHPSGVIVTNAHTVSQANNIQIKFKDGPRISAKIVRFINNLDLALLQIKPPFPLTAISLADSDEIQLGDEIINIGNSDLLDQSISGGKIIGLGTSRRLKQSGKNRTDLIQTTLNLYQGDSGGPLFDREGRLVGLMTAKETSADHSSFAIPSNKIKQQLIKYLSDLKREK